MPFLNQRRKGNRFVHSTKHLRTNCEPNAICFSHSYVVCSFCSWFSVLFSQQADTEKKIAGTLIWKSNHGHMPNAPWNIELGRDLQFPKMSGSSVGAASWSQLLMIPCFLLVGNRWRGLCPVGATVLGGWCFHNDFTIRGTGTHKHTHGALGMESYHLHWVQEVKSACIKVEKECPRSSVGLILSPVLITEEETRLLSSFCRSLAANQGRYTRPDTLCAIWDVGGGDIYRQIGFIREKVTDVWRRREGKGWSKAGGRDARAMWVIKKP